MYPSVGSTHTVQKWNGISTEETVKHFATHVEVAGESGSGLPTGTDTSNTPDRAGVIFEAVAEIIWLIAFLAVIWIWSRFLEIMGHITRGNPEAAGRTIERTGKSVTRRIAPKGWDKRNEVQLCPSCVTKHDNGYKKFFADFMASGKNEKKSD